MGFISVRDIQFLTAENERGRQPVQLHDFGVTGAGAEILLCDAPERIALDNGMDTVGFGLCLRTDNGEIIDSHPCVDARDLAAAGLFDLLTEQNAGLTAFHNRLTIGSGLRDDVVVVGLDPSGNGCGCGVVLVSGCLDLHLASFFDGRIGLLGFSHGSGCGRGLAVLGMTVAADGAVGLGIGVLLYLIAAVALDRDDLRGSDLDNDAGMVSPGSAAVAEEDLIADLGIHVELPLVLEVLHGVSTSCTQIPGLALNLLTLGRAVGFEEAPVHEDVTPCVAVLVAVVVSGVSQVAGVLRPVVRPGVGGLVVKTCVGGLFLVADLCESDGYDFTCFAHFRVPP